MSKSDKKTKESVKGDKANPTVTLGKVLPFDPLKHEVLGTAIAQVLASTKLHKLGAPFPLEGAGIYAIYYTGDNAPYSKLAQRNIKKPGSWPIYVGQALPAGARKGIAGDESKSKKKAPLKERLTKHAASIAEIEKNGGDLKVDDFQYRALVLNDTFIRLGEMSLLGIYAPVWNKYLDGFGNNAAGGNRASSKKSQWDTVHPGRGRVDTHSPRENFNPNLIRSEMKNYLDNFNLRDAFLRAEGQSAEPTLEINFAEAEELEANKRTGEAREDGNEA